MLDAPRPTLDQLLSPSSDQLQQETSLPGGHVPERWLQIEAIEVSRMRLGFEQTLQKRIDAYPEDVIPGRCETVREYLQELTLPSSYPHGPYAASRWLNLFELLPQIIDIQLAVSSVPDVDRRVPFFSLALQKDIVVLRWMVDRIQAGLPDGEKLRKEQIMNCFTNISQVQFVTVVNEIARSGISPRHESPRVRMARLASLTESTQ